MPTGIQSWSDPANIGPIYPFVGTELALAIIGIALWIAFHVLQTRIESQEWDEAEAAFDEKLLLSAGEAPRVSVPPAPVAPSSPAAAPPAAPPVAGG